jgi:hypothetical protein
MGHAILIETPFASATQTAKILGVSKFRKQQLVKMLKFKKPGSKGRFLLIATDSSKKNKSGKGTRWLVSSKSAGKSGTVNVKRRLSSKKHASKKTRTPSGGNSSQ